MIKRLLKMFGVLFILSCGFVVLALENEYVKELVRPNWHKLQYNTPSSVKVLTCGNGNAESDDFAGPCLMVIFGSSPDVWVIDAGLGSFANSGRWPYHTPNRLLLTRSHFPHIMDLGQWGAQVFSGPPEVNHYAREKHYLLDDVHVIGPAGTNKATAHLRKANRGSASMLKSAEVPTVDAVSEQYFHMKHGTRLKALSTTRRSAAYHIEFGGRVIVLVSEPDVPDKPDVSDKPDVPDKLVSLMTGADAVFHNVLNSDAKKMAELAAKAGVKHVYAYHVQNPHAVPESTTLLHDGLVIQLPTGDNTIREFSVR